MREIFYLSPAGAMMKRGGRARCSIHVEGTGKALSDPSPDRRGLRNRLRCADVAPDGRRFLVIKDGELESLAEPRLTVIQNWFEELQRLVPAVRR